MKALLISDVHSNIDALNAIWREEGDSDAVYCAGDIVDYGLFPKEVIAWMREHHAHCVMGNHDENLLEVYRTLNRRALINEPYTFAQYNASLLDEDDIAYLRGLPQSLRVELDGVSYYMKHFYVVDRYNIRTLSEYDKYWRAMAGEPQPGQERRLLFGHSHEQALIRFYGDALCLNPGSISYRGGYDDDTGRIDYATITDGRIELKRLRYDKSHLLPLMYRLNIAMADIHHGQRIMAP